MSRWHGRRSARAAAVVAAALLLGGCNPGTPVAEPGPATSSPDGGGSPSPDAPSPSAVAGDTTSPRTVPVVATRNLAWGPDEAGNQVDLDHPHVRGIDAAVADRINATIVTELGLGDGATPDWEIDPDYDGVSWDEYLAFSVGLATPHLLSFAFDSYLYTGGAHGLPGVWYLTFDLTTGELVDPVADLLAPGAAEVLSPFVKGQLDVIVPDGHDASDDVLVDNDTWSAGLDPYGNLVITFAAYGIGPYSIGMPTVTFAADELFAFGLVPDGPLEVALADAAREADADAARLQEQVDAFRAGGQACDGDVEDGVFQTHQAIPLDGRTVVFVACFDAAYQSLWHARSWDGATLGPIEVEQWRGDGVVTTPIVLGWPELGNGVIQNLTKDRGVGDCGLWQQWWIDESGRMVLLTARQRSCDDESEYVPPQQWPYVGP